MAGWRVGVDTGGTFTDVCLVEEATGRVAVWKIASTPDDPSRAIAAGIAEGMQRQGAPPPAIRYVGHGTTVATNALIQGRGAKTGLVTTQGFRDLLEIGRQKRPDLYDLQVDKPPVLVTRDLRREVPERLRHDGSVETPLDEDAVRAAALALREAGVEAAAICFLYSFVRPEHERRARAILEETLPGVFLTASHEIAPEFREYERLSTTVVNCRLGPLMRGYIARLAGRLRDLGIEAPPHLTQSNGGVIGVEAAARMPVRLVLSGPSTGVVGAAAIGRASGFPDLLTFDMGGTSTDVALLQGGQARLAPEAVVHGYPIKAPMLDIHTVGAGGGSIAHVDPGGLLKVGPRSAGADPGPACYGSGNAEATVTDANVLLGYLHPEALLGGRMPIRRALAEAAIARLAGRLGMESRATAEGILRIVTANMARALRVISIQRGHDPRDYTLMAFGGAGPLHAARLAEEMEMRRVLVPPHPGILCAMGLLLTDLRADFAATRRMRLDAAAPAGLAEGFAALDAAALRWFEEETIAPAARALTRTVDMRYAGQNYELGIAMPEGLGGAALVEALARRFDAAHEERYGFLAPEEPVQIVTLRLEATGAVPKPRLAPLPDSGPDPVPEARIGTREAWIGGAFRAIPVLDRARLAPGNRLAGPAILEQMDSTTLLPPGWTARVDAHANLVLEREA